MTTNDIPPDFRDREINIDLAGYIRDEIGTIDYGTVRVALTTDPRYMVRHRFYEGFCTYCRSKGVPQYKIPSEHMAIRQIARTYDLANKKTYVDGHPNPVHVFIIPPNIRIGDLDGNRGRVSDGPSGNEGHRDGSICGVRHDVRDDTRDSRRDRR